ncbi:MAG TPA: RtcB family protein, partial [Humisphaera sp.]
MTLTLDTPAAATTSSITPTGEATGFIPAPGSKGKPITVIGTQPIRDGFDAMCVRQALNSRGAPGVTDLVLNPDAHAGYGAPVGCVLVSPTHVYPGPVGVDIKCSMSLLQLDLPAEAVNDKRTRRALIDAVCARTPTGAGRGQRSVKHGRKVDDALGRRAAVEGASAGVCAALGIPPEWAARCEDSSHVGHDGTADALADRLDRLIAGGAVRNFGEKASQLGSYGGGNHFGECEVVHVDDADRARATADAFGLRDGHVAFLSHCGSRGLGHALAAGQFRALQGKFGTWDIPLPGGDRELVYAPLGTPEADAYLDDLALGSNFATVNHLLINALVLEAFQ